MNRAQLIDQVMYFDALARAAKEQAAAARGLLEDQARAEYAEGIKPQWATLTATVPFTVNAAKFVVTNRTEFVKWVAERYPDNVETFTQVRPAFEDNLLTVLAKNGDDPVSEDGEIIPGLTYIPSTPGGIQVRPKPDAKKAMDSIARTTLAQLAPHQNGESE